MSSPWKCPHCGTPQAEAARCWACKRSPLACSTCRDFRRSVAGRLGYCGKGKARAVLTGDEVRPCWSAPVSAEEPQLLGLFGALESSPATPATTARSDPATAPSPAATSRSRPDVPAAFLASPDVAATAPPQPVPADPVPEPVRRAPPPRGPAPTAAVAARRRWDSIVADVAAGAPLGSEPTGGATPSMPYRPAPGSTPIVPWLATAARAVDAAHAGDPGRAVDADRAGDLDRPGRPVRAATSTVTATPPQGTPATARSAAASSATPVALPAARPTAVPSAVDGAAFAAWATSEPAAPPAPPAASAAPPAPTPWSSPIPGASSWAQTTDDLTPSEPIRWRHRAVDDPVPPPAADTAAPAVTARRPGSLSLIPVTLANRLRRHLGTRGPRTDFTPATAAGPAASPATPSPLTTPSVRGATPITTARSAPYGRLVDAPPVTGTIMSLGDQLRRAEQLRRERALLDGERLGGESRLEPPA